MHWADIYRQTKSFSKDVFRLIHPTVPFTKDVFILSRVHDSSPLGDEARFGADLRQFLPRLPHPPPQMHEAVLC